MASPRKKSKKKRKTRRFLIYALIVIVVFVAGMMFAPLLQEKAYQLKDWLIKPPPADMKTVKLYFSEPNSKYLVYEERNILTFPEVTEEVKSILEELIRGPQNSSFSATLPPETEVRAAYIRDNFLYIDFSSSLRDKHSGGTTGELLTVYSIVNTLLDNFPSQSYVQILIEGMPEETLAGHIDIRNPLGKNPDIIKNP